MIIALSIMDTAKHNLVERVELEALYVDLSQRDTINRIEWYTSKILLDEQMFKHAWMWIALIDIE